MLHNVPLIATLASGFGLALILGIIAARLKLPSLVGYLIAGIIIGPFTPGFVADPSIAAELAEIGVILLMFGVGLHFSFSDLLAVRKIALPGALIQIIVATSLGMGIALLLKWPIGSALVFGLSLSIASTVVLLRALEGRGALDSMNGRIAVGWLVVEDLVMVMVLVLLPPLAGWLGGEKIAGDETNLWQTFAFTLLKVAAFIALMLIVGRRVFPKLLWLVTSTGSRELFTLCVIATAISIAYGATALFGVSFALGAFFAGMMMRESEFSHRAAIESLPFREAFAVLFFVAIGMLFDPSVLITHPLEILAVVAVIVLGKALAAALLVLAFRYPLNTALVVSVSLAQIGEFSFILAGLGTTLKLIPKGGESLILAGGLISIALNPLLFAGIEPIRQWLLSRSAFARRLEQPMDVLAELPTNTAKKYLSHQIVLIGYGKVGRYISEHLLEKKLSFVIAEQNRELVQQLRDQGIPAVSGDAADPAVLVQAHIAHARLLVIALSDTVKIRSMISNAQVLNPHIEILVRTHNEAEAEFLQSNSAVTVFLAKKELANNMSQHILERIQAPSA